MIWISLQDEGRMPWEREELMISVTKEQSSFAHFFRTKRGIPRELSVEFDLIPPLCFSFKRNFYNGDLLQVWECTQVPTIYTNVFAVSFAYTTFVVMDFAITARS